MSFLLSHPTEREWGRGKNQNVQLGCSYPQPETYNKKSIPFLSLLPFFWESVGFLYFSLVLSKGPPSPLLEHTCPHGELSRNYLLLLCPHAIHLFQFTCVCVLHSMHVISFLFQRIHGMHQNDSRHQALVRCLAFLSQVNNGCRTKWLWLECACLRKEQVLG